MSQTPSYYQDYSEAIARAHLANFPPIYQVDQPKTGKEDTEDEKYQCQLCPRKFARLYNLKSHVKTHENKRPFECTLCEQKFTRNHDLNRHLKTHSQERPHICQTCGRQFARRDALKRHERMNEEGKKVHCIPNPEKVFRASAALTEYQPQFQIDPYRDQYHLPDNVQHQLDHLSRIAHADFAEQKLYDTSAVMSFTLSEEEMNLMHHQQAEALKAVQKAIREEE